MVWCKNVCCNGIGGFCAMYEVMRKESAPPSGSNFVYKEIQHYKYLVVEHIGSMDKIYETYGMIYQGIYTFTRKLFTL